MFTVYTLKTAKDAAKYYQKESYYIDKEKSTEEYTTWYGKGAERLGLQSAVDYTQFSDKLSGKISENSVMLNIQNGKHHRPGYDLTFSAPKSVSLLGLLGKDQNMIMAHRQAVTQTLHMLEEKYAAVRRKVQGEIHIEKTDNLTFALFEHKESRALDPDLHTHSVLMNFTLRADGQWRTLYADELYNDEIMIGITYRSFLAKELMRMGYQIVQTSDKATFELDGFDAKLLEQFSKRRKQIVDKLSEMGATGGKAAMVANFLTRQQKKEYNLEQIELQWKQELESCGYSLDWLQQYSKDAKERGPVSLEPSLDIIKKSVHSAIQHLSQKKAVFTLHELKKTAMGMAFLHAGENAIFNEINQQIEQFNLLPIEKERFTTPAAREKEITVGAQLRQDKNQVAVFVGKRAGSLIAKLATTDTYQQAVIEHILTSKDRQIGIISEERKDDIQLMCTLRKLRNYIDYTPMVLTQKREAVTDIKQQTGLSQVYTVHGFLQSCVHRAAEKQGKPVSRQAQYNAKQLWVVDPTARISLDQAAALQQWAKHFGARIVWSGKEYQPTRLFTLFTQHDIAVPAVNKMEERETKQALFSQRLTTLHQTGQIQCNKNTNERIGALLDHVFGLDTKSRTVLVGSEADKHLINQRIREQMREKGELGEEQVKYTSLQPIYYSDEQKKWVHFYQPGDILYCREAVEGSKLLKSTYYTVQHIELSKNSLTLMGADAKQVDWQPQCEKNADVELYRTESRELRVGDSLVWTKTFAHEKDRALDRNLGETARVVAIDNHIATVALQSKKHLTLDRTDLSLAHIEYGYARTLPGAIPSSSQTMALFINAAQLPFLDRDKLLTCFQNPKCKIFCDELSKLYHIYTDEKAQPDLAIRNKPVQGQVMITGEANSKQQIVQEAVHYAYSHYSERDAVFDIKKAMKTAFEFAGLHAMKEDIEQGFSDAFNNKILMEVGENKIATVDALSSENACLQYVQEGKNRVEAILPPQHPLLQTLEANTHLTQGQKEAVALILTTTDRVIGIQGVAGAGKTTMLKEVNKTCRLALNEVDRLSQGCGYKLMGLANTVSAKNRIIEANETVAGTAIPAMTTKKFIRHAEKLLATDPQSAQSLYGKNQIFVLDEASLVSTQDMYTVLTLVERLDSRLLLVGDVKQLSPIEAGNPWRLLLGSEMQSVAIQQNVRFKDPEMVAMMKDLYAGNIEQAIQRLAPKTVEIPDREELLKAIAHFYVQQPKEMREKALVISPRNEDRVSINSHIREAFKKEGTLTGTEYTTQVLVSKDMTQAEKSNFHAYKLGNCIQFNYASKRLGVQAGDYLQVVDKDMKHHRMTLKCIDGRTIEWSPRYLPKWSGAIEVYELAQRGLMVGDSIRWKKNDESRAIVNGEIAKVVKLEGAIAIVSLKNGSLQDIDLNTRSNQHWDHAYASTVFVAQGQDVSLTIGLCQGPKPYERKTEDLCVGDVVTFSDNSTEQSSKLVTVKQITPAQLVLEDRDKKLHILDMEKIKGNTWAYFPPFNEREKHQLPTSSNLSSFLVQATRGDNFVMFVDNLEHFKQTIAVQSGVKETAMQYIDPSWSTASQRIENMTRNVAGTANVTKERITAPMTDAIGISK